ncbi:MAG: HD domain-containing protein [Armatimonadetes bacterium]|nr:HD domain-containing protein [Armatimonadota bacterium]
MGLGPERQTATSREISQRVHEPSASERPADRQQGPEAPRPDGQARGERPERGHSRPDEPPLEVKETGSAGASVLSQGSAKTGQQSQQLLQGPGMPVVEEPGGQGDQGGGDGSSGSGRRDSESTRQAGSAPGPAQPQTAQEKAVERSRQSFQTSARTQVSHQLAMNRLSGMAGSRSIDHLASQTATQAIGSLLKSAYRKDRLEQMSESDAVNQLTLVLKMGGEFTYAHSARVLDLAMDLADEVGVSDRGTRRQIQGGALFKDLGKVGLELNQLPQSQLAQMGGFLSSQDMLRAGLLHDIGKVKIPKELLYKPGRLTEQEFQVIKMHPIYSEEILYPIPSLRHLCPTVRGHHERWDGKGYPDGLKGEQIPLAARIIAVADVFDALAAPRPYKPGMDIPKVREILNEGRGSHFDPRLVDAFLRVLDRRYGM